MKSYGDLKAQWEVIKQQMLEAKKNGRANLLKEIKCLCKESKFTYGILRVVLDGVKDKKYD